MTPTLYGIPNCDTLKKARAWLEANGVDYRFHDYKKSGIDAATLQKWTARVGFAALLNTRGTTWRKLDETARSDVDAGKAIALMMQHPSLIKRPVLAAGSTLLVGFNEADWQTLL
jgi:arsenate reductase